MVMAWALPVARSFADTCRIPLASMSNVTSICGTPRGAGGMPTRWNFPSGPVVPGQLALALQDVDLDGGLVVGRGREDLGLLGRDRGVPLDEPGHDAAERLDAERERSDVEEKHVLHLAGEDARLDGGADGHDLVGVDALVGLLAEEVLDELLDLRHAGHAADEHDLVDVLGLEPGVLEGLADRAHRALQEIVDDLLELRPGQLQGQVLRAGGVGGDEGQVDLRLHASSTARTSPSPRPPSGAGAPSCPSRGRCPGPS